jgi:hypothetical protein
MNSLAAEGEQSQQQHSEGGVRVAGAGEIAEIARFATTLHPRQRRELGLPRKRGTSAFYQVPGYSVFYEVLKRLDAAAFAEVLSTWLQARAGQLPAALAMDGKMIRAHIGLTRPARLQHRTRRRRLPLRAAPHDHQTARQNKRPWLISFRQEIACLVARRRQTMRRSMAADRPKGFP